MCMIAVKSKGKILPEKQHLRNGYEKNKDGMGIAYWKKGEKIVHVKKDFKDFEELWNFIETNIKKEDSLIVHFRTSTGGKTDNGASHPYPITDKKKLIRKVNFDFELVMAHNGTISAFGGDKIYSDTQKFILYLLSKSPIKENIDNPYIMELIEMAVKPSRIVIMNKEGNVILLGNWEKEKNIYYSNTQYKYELTKPKQLGLISTSKSYYGFSKWDNWEDNYYGYSSGEFYSKCDGCGQYKTTKEIKYKKNYLFLCKDCRRDLSLKDTPSNAKPTIKLLKRGFSYYSINRLSRKDKELLVDGNFMPTDVSITLEGKLILLSQKKRCVVCDKEIKDNEKHYFIDKNIICEQCNEIILSK